MRQYLILTVILLGSIECFAQKSNFGIMSYAPPAGYELIKNDNVLTYYIEDKNTGAYCNFFLYKMIPGKGSVQNDFDFAWSNQVQKPFKVTGGANMQPVAVLKGWQFLMGNTKYADNGIATLAMLITFSGENNMQSICILSNSDKYKTDIENFIASIDIAGDAKSETPNTSVKTNQGSLPVTKKTTVVSNTNNIKYAVWQCQAANISSLQLEFKTVVLSPDGKCLYYMPENGLNGVTPANSNDNGSWGIITDKGNMLQLRNAKSGNMELYKISATAMGRYPNSKTNLYKKVKQVDGLRFEGSYSPELSYYNGKTDIISKQIDANKRPIIFFKKDGTFINEGLEFSNITHEDSYALGKGNYEIINYSLILTTQAGRKLQVAFTPVSDANPAAADNGGLIINNVLFWRLNKTFVPHN